MLAAQGRTLILAPASLQDVWEEEISNWQPDITSAWISYGGLCKRVASQPGKAASMVLPVPRDEIPRQWDTVICDEAHRLKNRSTSWTKALLKIRTDRLFLATGTPLPNWGHEVYMFLRFLFPGDRRFTNYWDWVDEFFRISKPPYGGTRIGKLRRGIEWDEIAQEWGLAERWLRRTFDDVLPDLPPMTSQAIKVKMAPKQAAVYQQLHDAWWAQLPETGNEVVSWNDGGIHSKLLQCSTGLSTLDEGETASGKLDLVRELMAERQHPTILFCAFKKTAEALGVLMNQIGRSVGVVSSRYTMSERFSAIREFKEGRLDVLVGTIGTMSEGVTLTRADTCIFVERSPRPVSNDQARGRVRRFGQDRPTLAIDIITEGTVDEDLSLLLTDKSSDINLALTGLQLAKEAKI